MENYAVLLNQVKFVFKLFIPYTIEMMLVVVVQQIC